MLARLLLLIALFQLLLLFAFASLVYWPWPPLVVTGYLAYRKLRRAPPLWSHGTSAFASEWTLRMARMIGTNRGLIVGRLGHPGRTPVLRGIRALLWPGIPSKAACAEMLSCLLLSLRIWWGGVVRVNKTPHALICGPTGAGKGASFAIPWLLDVDESAAVLDMKGELAVATMEHRRKQFRHHVVLLDPFHVVTKTPDSLNPLDFIDVSSDCWIDDCRDLAELLVVRTGTEREPHWNEVAETMITAGIVAVVQSTNRTDRSLQTVRDILCNPANIPRLVEALSEIGGMVSRLGGQLAYFQDKELASTLTTSNRNLRFLDTPAVAACTASSSFDPAKLRNGKMTAYCILPPNHMRTQSSLLRIWIGTLMRAVVKGGLQHG